MSASALGPPTREFKNQDSSGPVRLMAVGLVCCTALAVNSIGLGALSMVSALALGGGVVAAVGLLYWFRSARRGVVKTVALHADGVSFGRDGEQHAYPWADIATVVVNEVYRHTRRAELALVTFDLAVRFRDDQQLQLRKAFGETPLIASEIESESLPHLAAETAEDWRSGASIQFGPILLDNLGIRPGDDFVLWTELADAQLQLGNVELISQRTIEIRRADVPNAAVLVWLIGEILATMRNNGGLPVADSRPLVGASL